MKLLVGEGSCGLAAGAGAVYARLDKLLSENNPNQVQLGITGCIGMCFLEPIVDLYDDEGEVHRLVRLKEKDADLIYDAVCSKDFSLLDRIHISDDDAGFLEKQTRIALRDCGLIDPCNIDEYIARDGYAAIGKILEENWTQE